MDNKEALRKAQAERKDEREVLETYKSMLDGEIAMLAASFALMLLKIFTDNVWYDVYAIMFAGMAGNHVYKGIKLGQKHEIILGIAASLGCLLAIAGAVCGYLGL